MLRGIPLIGLIKIVYRFFKSRKIERISFDFNSQRTDFNNFDDEMLVSQIGFYGHHVEKALKHQKRGKRGVDKKNRLANLLKEYSLRKKKDTAIIKWATNISNLFDKKHKFYVTEISNDLEKKNDVLDFIKNRVSVRFWKNKKIEKNVLENILRISLSSPISCNRQSIRFLVKKKKPQKV